MPGGGDERRISDPLAQPAPDKNQHRGRRKKRGERLEPAVGRGDGAGRPGVRAEAPGTTRPALRCASALGLGPADCVQAVRAEDGQGLAPVPAPAPDALGAASSHAGSASLATASPSGASTAWTRPLQGTGCPGMTTWHRKMCQPTGLCPNVG